MTQHENRRCVIFAGGEITDSMRTLITSEDFILAADAGILAVERFGLKPDLCLGDWDSAPRPQTTVRCLTLPAEKDDTDTYYAARLAIEKGFGEVLILGGLGGRFDHTMANISTLLFLKQNGVSAVLEDDNSRITVLHNEEKEFFKREGFYLSVFALEKRAQGVFIRGAKYPLHNAELNENFPLGVSNEIIEEKAIIKVEKGTVLVMYAR